MADNIEINVTIPPGTKLREALEITALEIEAKALTNSTTATWKVAAMLRQLLTLAND